jgi:hypothetical protein
MLVPAVPSLSLESHRVTGSKIRKIADEWLYAEQTAPPLYILLFTQVTRLTVFT